MKRNYFNVYIVFKRIELFNNQYLVFILQLLSLDFYLEKLK